MIVLLLSLIIKSVLLQSCCSPFNECNTPLSNGYSTMSITYVILYKDVINIHFSFVEILKQDEFIRK